MFEDKRVGNGNLSPNALIHCSHIRLVHCTQHTTPTTHTDNCVVHKYTILFLPATRAHSHTRAHTHMYTHTHTHSTHRPCISWLGRRRSRWECHAALDEKPSTRPGSAATPAHDREQTQESDIDHLWQLCREQYLKQ